MNRYIDADKLKDKFCEACSTKRRYRLTNEECRNWEHAYGNKCFKMRLIDEMPTAEIVEDALGKRTPKKPEILKIHDISGYKYGDCECGEHISDDEKYCSSCGQAIDWGE